MRILIIGPFPPPITGHSNANQCLKDGLINNRHELVIIDTGTSARIEDSSKQGRFRFIKFFKIVIEIIFHFKKILASDIHVGYLTPGQTFLGYLRFVPYLIICRLKGIPTILHFHGGYFQFMYHSLGSLGRNLVKISFNLVSHTIVLGDSLRSMFSDVISDDKISVCENGVDEELILSEPEVLAKIQRIQNSKYVRVLFLSNIIRSKGVLDLLDAVELLKNQGVNIYCDVAGAIDEDIRIDFQNRLDRLTGIVIYHGVVKGIKKRNLLEQSDIFCLPTYFPVEGQPISILEAYGAGCAVVCTDHAGIKDIFKNSTHGIFCEAKHPQSIAQAILKAKSLPQNVHIQNRNECATLYTSTAFTQRVENIMKICLA